MTIVVCLKSCRRTDTPLRLNPDGRLVGEDETAQQPTSHELAPLLAALALKTRMPGARMPVMAVSVGPPSWEPLLRNALALGADEVLRVWGKEWKEAAGDDCAADTRDKARAAAEVISRWNPALVLTGERSHDSGHECFGAFLAQRLGMAFAHQAVELVPLDEGWQVRVKLERGYTQHMTVNGPAVVTLAGQSTEVPYPSLPAWRAALSVRIPLTVAPGTAWSSHRITLRPPLPRVKRYVMPEEGLDAESRIRAMVSLPVTESGTLLPADLGAAEQARMAARFLKERGYP